MGRKQERVSNVCEMLEKSVQEYLPHYVTINDCLKKLNSDELEKARNKLMRNLIKKFTL